MPEKPHLPGCSETESSQKEKIQTTKYRAFRSPLPPAPHTQLHMKLFLGPSLGEILKRTIFFFHIFGSICCFRNPKLIVLFPFPKPTFGGKSNHLKVPCHCKSKCSFS